MKEMLYLGHIISTEGVQVHMEKIRAILDWPKPKTVTELKGFLGLCTYYRRYVKGFSHEKYTCSTLSTCLKKPTKYNLGANKEQSGGS